MAEQDSVEEAGFAEQVAESEFDLGRHFGSLVEEEGLLLSTLGRKNLEDHYNHKVTILNSH